MNTAKRPVYRFNFRKPDGSVETIVSPDPGRALITGDLNPFDSLNAFKIPQLRGIRRTAPYFHDNSAATLEDVVKHYKRFFEVVDARIKLTDQDLADMVAYMMLLD